MVSGHNGGRVACCDDTQYLGESNGSGVDGLDVADMLSGNPVAGVWPPVNRMLLR